MFKFNFLVVLFIVFNSDCVNLLLRRNVEILVKNWATELGKELYNLSMTMTRKDKVVERFKPLRSKIRYDDGMSILRSFSSEINKLMKRKTEAVYRIAEYAEYLAYHRKTTFIDDNYHFYNAGNITNTTSTCDVDKELELELRKEECIWWCQQKNPSLLSDNFYSNYSKRLELFHSITDITRCNYCASPLADKPQLPIEHYNALPLKHYLSFKDIKVNLNLSVVKINANIYHKDQDVLQGVRWTEPLDLVFKQNMLKDATLKYQYFASPLGYMRHFPAIQWPDEQYAQTYDPRMRSWYTEAMTSPKNILILLDKSGSVCKKKRKIAAHIVNNILDTLNDNDFVNVYLFTNYTEPLVDCFNDTLVQANEENLRLLRETLDNYTPHFQADITIGLEKAFEVLRNFKPDDDRVKCNQAIMLITEQAFMSNEAEFFKTHNWKFGTPVRIFTYQLDRDDGDARLLEWMACANKGYFVNITLMEEVREKVLPYINVMSRTINHPNKNQKRWQKPIWSYLYIDLADRRFTNWLWRKLEGNRQRAIFLDHAKREFMRLNKVLTSESHFLLKESHDYEKYEKKNDFDYMTTLSLPVYGRRPEDLELIGVAAVDVPLKLIKSLTPHHKIGVNGYAFIVTNNGYILMHAAHIPEFKHIPKPTFNRVDLLEVEILDDMTEPRLFNESIVKLREQMVQHKSLYAQESEQVLKVKFALDDMKRIMLISRKYFFTSLEHFTIGIALPEDYGLMVVSDINTSHFNDNLFRDDDFNWEVHPDWVYCDGENGRIPKGKVKACLRKRKIGPLLGSLLFDANATSWFRSDIRGQEKFVQKYHVGKVFIGTHSGLTRWKIFKHMEKYVDDEDVIGKKQEFPGNRTIDEVWYKRTVEENFNKDENMFIYSVPFEISGYENDTMITSTNTIFVNVSVNGSRIRQSPVAVVGLQFNHKKMLDFYKKLAKEVGLQPELFRIKKYYIKLEQGRHKYCYSFGSIEPFQCGESVRCFVVDNNAYVVLSDEIEYTGRFIGDIISPFITERLVTNGVYIRTRMYDYQAICQKPPESKNKNSASRLFPLFKAFLENLLQVTNWALATILMLVTSVAGGRDYESTKNETLLYEKLEINKTVPTPCDQEFWLFTLGENFSSVGLPNKTTNERCDWYYIVERIPNSNLLFMAVNYDCSSEINILSTMSQTKSPTPMEIEYNQTVLACYIAVNNKYKRRNYMECHNNSTEEMVLNGENRTYCGHTWV